MWPGCEFQLPLNLRLLNNSQKEEGGRGRREPEPRPLRGGVHIPPCLAPALTPTPVQRASMEENKVQIKVIKILVFRSRN